MSKKDRELGYKTCQFLWSRFSFIRLTPKIWLDSVKNVMFHKTWTVHEKTLFIRKIY